MSPPQAASPNSDTALKAGETGAADSLGEVDLVIVGAGFAGIYMSYRARQLGLSYRVFERGSGAGGTWFWNRYPGARCDVHSLEYSYQFDDALQQEWQWTEKFASQPEILRYVDHVIERFDLAGGITFNTHVQGAVYDEVRRRWTVTTAGDETGSIRSRFLVLATGCLSSANRPGIAGLDSFGGDVYHTGEWPHDGVDFAGKRVAVIGTGSSGIQSIPIIATEAAHLTVFQRTAAYTVPARNEPLDPAIDAEVKAAYTEFRAKDWQESSAFGIFDPRSPEHANQASPAERNERYEQRWQRGSWSYLRSYVDHILSEESNGYAAEFVRDKIRKTVQDPTTAELLCPTTIIGCKRLCFDTGYYETFNRENVELVGISDTPIERIEPTGVVVDDTLHEVDIIVFATGFDAMTGSLLKIDPVGKDGTSLSTAWEAGPVTYLGLSVAGFPNMFTITGPGSPSVLANMITCIEQHVNWIADLLAHMEAKAIHTVEAETQAVAAWVQHVNNVAHSTLFPSCNSWYLGANIPGKPRVFMPLLGFPAYAQRCDEVAEQGYEGFVLRGADSI